MYPDCANITTKQGGQQKDVTPVRQQRDIVFTQTPATVHVNTLNSYDRRRAPTSGKYINIIFISRILLIYVWKSSIIC